MSDDAAKLRAQMPTSTDAARLEREAERIERQSGIRYLCDMPGNGPWKLTQFRGDLVAASEVWGVFRLELTEIRGETKAEWVEIKAP